MSYVPSLEIRHCEAITLPVIPQRAMVIPMPGFWFDDMNAHGMNPAVEVADLVCRGLISYTLPGDPEPRDDFPAMWGEFLDRRTIPPGREWKRVIVPIRDDVWRCVEKVAAIVECTAHEVFLKCLARQLEILAAERSGRANSIQKRREAPRSASNTNPRPLSLNYFEYYAKASRCDVEIWIPEEWATELEMHSLPIAPMLANLVTEVGSQGTLLRADFPRVWRGIRPFSLPWKKGTKLRLWKETLPAYLVNFVHAAAFSCEVRPDEIVWCVLAHQLPLHSNLPPLKKSYRKKGITRKTAMPQSPIPSNAIPFPTAYATR